MPINLTAARGKGDGLCIGIVNADPGEVAEVDLSVAAKGRAVLGQMLTARAMDSRNDRFGAPEDVHPVPFKGARWSDGKLRVETPAKSVVVLTLK